MPKILTIASHYLPGYKAGGTIRALANTIDWIGDQIQFYIVTLDRDFGDTQPYPNVQTHQWQSLGNAQVMYLPPDSFRIDSLRRLLWTWEKTLAYDVLYVDNFFATSTVSILALRRLGQIPAKPMILPTKGMLAPGALSLKSWKKRPYLFLSRLFGFYTGVTWVATSDFETQEIRGFFKDDIDRQRSQLYKSPSLPPRQPVTLNLAARPLKTPGTARFAFISRVSRKKNLDMALRLLANVVGRVEFDIYGPIEDQTYWNECQLLIKAIPANVTVCYRGAIPAEEVIPTFAKYHLFLFPTRGENYGYVILEALYGGCLILTSDMTFWRDLEAKQIGWDFPLSAPDRFQMALTTLIEMDETTFQARSALAHALGKMMMEDQDVVEICRQLFQAAFASNRGDQRGTKTLVSGDQQSDQGSEGDQRGDDQRQTK